MEVVLCTAYLCISPVTVVVTEIGTGFTQALWESGIVKYRTNFLVNKTNKAHEFPKFYFVKKLCMFRAFSLPIIRSFLLTFDTGIFLAGLMTASKQMELHFHPDPAWKLSAELQEI